MQRRVGEITTGQTSVYIPILLSIGGGVTILAGILGLERVRAAAEDRRSAPGSEDAEESGLRLCEFREAHAQSSVDGPVSIVAYAAARATRSFGVLNPALVCPHCGAGGTVRTKAIRFHRREKRVGPASLTAGFTAFASHFTRKRRLTRAHCGTCETTWHLWM